MLFEKPRGVQESDARSIGFAWGPFSTRHCHARAGRCDAAEDSTERWFRGASCRAGTDRRRRAGSGAHAAYAYSKLGVRYVLYRQAAGSFEEQLTGSMRRSDIDDGDFLKDLVAEEIP